MGPRASVKSARWANTVAEPLSRRDCLRRLGAMPWLAGLGSGLVGCEKSGISDMPENLAGGWVGGQHDAAHAWRDGKLPEHATGVARSTHTLVIGAGVAGLSAARHLIDAGLDDVIVLDLEAQPGGNARGHDIGGMPCPLGAHYLPLPGPDATEVARWLEAIGLIRHEHGRWVGDERYLCHSPQERLFVPDGGLSASAPRGFWASGQWQDGVVPQVGLQASDEAEYRRFSERIARMQAELGFAMPTWRRAWSAGLEALDRMSFAQWLNQEGFSSVPLLWLLDYACRDDFGAGLARVSAWAGIHYFASRHGFEWPAQAESHDPVFTWPQGNGWLTQKLAQGLGDRWRPGQLAVSVEEGRHAVTVQVWDGHLRQMRQWSAKQVILAVPLFVARRLLRRGHAALDALVPHMQYAPWLVSNVLLKEGLRDRSGVAMAWDNVAFTHAGTAPVSTPSLGYVDARHQSLSQVTGSMLWTHYWALGGQSAAQGQALRSLLLRRPWADWARWVLMDLAQVHPDLPGLVERVDLMRYGHAMSIPVPGVRSHPGLAALQSHQGRLLFAHADLSAYSVFEEAFTHGARAATQVLAAVGIRRSIN